jgi:hypothetical protein
MGALPPLHAMQQATCLAAVLGQNPGAGIKSCMVLLCLCGVCAPECCRSHTVCTVILASGWSSLVVDVKLGRAACVAASYVTVFPQNDRVESPRPRPLTSHDGCACM